MVTIATINLKGGVGKTVTSANLGVCLGMKGHRVLLVDLDGQSNLTQYVNCYDDETPSVADVLIRNPFLPISKAIRPTAYENVSIAPATFEFIDADSRIMGDMTRSRDFRLKNALREVQNEYDFCVLDCSPALDQVTINAIMAADFILVPFKPDKFAMTARNRILHMMHELERGFERAFPPIMVVFTLTDGSKVARSIMELILNNPSREEHIFRTTIRRSTKTVESTVMDTPVVVYCPSATTSEDYVNLTQEVLSYVRYH